MTGHSKEDRRRRVPQRGETHAVLNEVAAQALLVGNVEAQRRELRDVGHGGGLKRLYLTTSTVAAPPRRLDSATVPAHTKGPSGSSI